jgi:hypothetical protein
VHIKTARGLVWYVTDVVLNLSVLPNNPVVKTLFRLSRSAPGLKFNNIAPIFMVKDKAALRRWLAIEFEQTPPRWLIPAHGDIVDCESNRDARRLFAAR